MDQHHLSDLESIPNQIGTAILRSSDGELFRQPSGTLSEHDVGILYQMLIEVGGVIVRDEKLRRVTVEGGNGVTYSMCAAMDGYIYIVKRRVVS